VTGAPISGLAQAVLLASTGNTAAMDAASKVLRRIIFSPWVFGGLLG
jgi:hypothetical protein